MTDDRPFDFEGLLESSESTQIVDATRFRQAAKLQQQRDQAYLIVIAGPHVGKMFKIEKEETMVGRSSRADLFVQDVGISRMHARIFSQGSDVFVEDLQSANGTYLNGNIVTSQQRLQDGDKITLGSTTILKFTYHDELDENFQQQMFDAALRDGLTKAFNKSYFITQLQTEFAFALRHGTALSLIMFDVDHFKPVNDNYGHLAGDAVLIKLAELTAASLRSEDIFARYGGEEFAVICRGINSQQAGMLAERLRKVVNSTPFFYDGRNIAISISLGVASVLEIGARNHEELIAAADAALYDAKNAGRNRVMIAQTI